MVKPNIRLVTAAPTPEDVGAPANSQAFRLEAARMLHAAMQRESLSEAEALEVIDAITLATIKGLEQYLTRQP